MILYTAENGGEPPEKRLSKGAEQASGSLGEGFLDPESHPCWPEVLAIHSKYVVSIILLRVVRQGTHFSEARRHNILRSTDGRGANDDSYKVYTASLAAVQ